MSHSSSFTTPDTLLAPAATPEQWSELTGQIERPQIDVARLGAYRLARLREQLVQHGAAMCVLHNPISLRYAVDHRSYSLFQSRIPTAYVFLGVEGPVIAHEVYNTPRFADEVRPGRPISVFDGGDQLPDYADALAADVRDYLRELGSDNRRVAVEYVNPTIVQAFERHGLEVIDGVQISEMARVIKSVDEMACIRWAVAVAEHGIRTMQCAITPGVTELQLWGLINYVNIANDGDWHEGRMLASGPRTNPWLQEASTRRVEAGDLVAFDTDMVGPFGYFADVSRTLVCGGGPNASQMKLFELACEEIAHNMALLKPGVTLGEFQRRAYVPGEAYRRNAYTCVIHGVGMCDEYPQVKHAFRSPLLYDGVIEAGMVLCVESYMGAEGGSEGVKLEQQVLITDDGCEVLPSLPLIPA